LRSRAGIARTELQALDAAAIDLICGPTPARAWRRPGRKRRGS
jgi:hypothetical protein